jgi:hypothetical protein
MEDSEVFVPLLSNRYTGHGQNVDDAWEELIWGTGLLEFKAKTLISLGRYFRATKEEAKTVWKHNYTDLWDKRNGGFMIG